MNKKFITDSLYLASYLVAEDFQIDKIEKVNPESNKFIFVFHNTSSLETLAEDYYSLKALVNPQKYNNALKNLRQVIYSKRDSEF